jgi:hypothetical protein
MADSFDDNRPKKSWKEIDQRRESGRKNDDAGGGARERRPTHAYNAYKNQLGRLFDQGGIGATPEGAELAKTDLAAQRGLLAITNPLALQKAAIRHIAAAGMPTDPEVLMALLVVSDEKLIKMALEALAEALGEGKIKRLQTLRSRLTTLKLTCDAPKIVALAQGILAQL